VWLDGVYVANEATHEGSEARDRDHRNDLCDIAIGGLSGYGDDLP
jgi:hypothetical protein